MMAELRSIIKRAAIVRLLSENRGLITTANQIPSPRKVVK